MRERENKVRGSVKSTVGKVTGDEGLEAQGDRQKAVGNVQEGGRKVREAIEDTISKVRKA
ncbi:MAG TPA: CsbD family protein [Candidatus Dormibacteraeota bacterium]|jgi:uncharacterized protein YjbJ (UPF0337 family)